MEPLHPTGPFTPAPQSPSVPTPVPAHHTPLIAWAIATVALIACGYTIFAGTTHRWPFSPVPTATPSPSVSVSPSPSPVSVEYRNEQYGFRIPLPDSWKGYIASTSAWSGTLHYANSEKTGSDTGPKIVLNFPGASDVNPHEAMPIMVFTYAQWELVTTDGPVLLTVSAAPVEPSELGRNSKYVFALPPRYNFDQKPGVEEVDLLVHGLRSFEPKP